MRFGNAYVFPGGIYDKKDRDLKQTAIRETYEEVGLWAKRKEKLIPFIRL